MPVPFSEDLRWRIVWQSVYKEANPEEIAESLYVSARTVRRIVGLFLATGYVASRVSVGRPRTLTSLEETLVLNVIFENPGIYLDEVQRYLEEKAGVVVSIPTICRTTQRLGLTRRKIRHLVLTRSEAERAAFSVRIEDIDASYFVWLDESGVDRRDSLRRMGYSLRGIAPVSQKLMGRGKRFSALASMSTRGIEDVELLEGGVDGINFCDYIERSVLPVMMPFDGVNPRSILIMDNASIHHVQQVQDLVDNAGCLLWFLPAYSPDMNPIEEVFSQVKRELQKNAAVYQSCQNPRLVIYSAFMEVKAADCAGYIKHAGYKI